ncbi:MAG: hypothetical protein QXT64_08515, partial [Desulfurococcaceae archaeon]
MRVRTASEAMFFYRCTHALRVRLSVQENLLPGDSLVEKLAAAERLGFDGVEFWGHDIERRLPELKQALSTVRVKASTICSGYGGDLL